VAGDDYGATIAKRRLSRILAELRIKHGYTANQVTDKLNWGRGKVGRFEANVWRRPEMSDIRDLLRIYGVDEADRSRLEALAMLARTRPWWREYPDVFDNEFPGFENDAARIRTYMPLVLPGLLQTRRYIEAHMSAGSKPPEWRGRALAARQRRQAILGREGGTAPELVAVITEASLMYQWGSREDRRAQIAHLVEMSRRPNVELRLLRFADGPHPGMNSLINIFDYPDDLSSVFLEDDVTIQEVNDPQGVQAMSETFGLIRDAAMEPVGTMAYLKQLTETLE
jgi:transcriptional regulator with XRE-family HTH domain